MKPPPGFLDTGFVPGRTSGSERSILGRREKSAPPLSPEQFHVIKPILESFEGLPGKLQELFIETIKELKGLSPEDFQSVVGELSKMYKNLEVQPHYHEQILGILHEKLEEQKRKEARSSKIN